MKTAKTDLYFGLDEFKSLKEKFLSKTKSLINSSSGAQTEDNKNEFSADAVFPEDTESLTGKAENADTDESEIKNEIRQKENYLSDTFKSLKSGFSLKGTGIFVFVLIIAATITSIITINLKIKKKYLSYELSKQTALMKRLSQKKAIFELEYAFLKSIENIEEYADKHHWVHILPKDITFIPLNKKSKLLKRRNSINIKNIKKTETGTNPANEQQKQTAAKQADTTASND